MFHPNFIVLELFWIIFDSIMMIRSLQIFLILPLIVDIISFQKNNPSERSSLNEWKFRILNPSLISACIRVPFDITQDRDYFKQRFETIPTCLKPITREANSHRVRNALNTVHVSRQETFLGSYVTR